MCLNGLIIIVRIQFNADATKAVFYKSINRDKACWSVFRSLEFDHGTLEIKPVNGLSRTQQSGRFLNKRDTIMRNYDARNLIFSGRPRS